MKLVKLNRGTGGPIYVNPDQVVHVYGVTDAGGKRTVVRTILGEITIREPVTDVVAQIADSVLPPMSQSARERP